MNLVRRKSFIIWVFGLFAATVYWTSTLVAPTIQQPYDTAVFDLYQKIKPRRWANSNIIIVDIDNASIKQIGQWPWPRSKMAQLTEQLGSLGAATVTFDIIFSEPDRTSPFRTIKNLTDAGVKIELPDTPIPLDNDAILAKAFSHNSVVTSIVLSRDGPDEVPPPKAGTGIGGTVPKHIQDKILRSANSLPALIDAAKGVGFINYSTEQQSDVVVRKTALLQGANGTFYPSLAMETLRVVQGAGSFKLKTSDGSGELGTSETSIIATQVGALTIPTDALGNLDIYHSKTSEKPTISAQSLFNLPTSGTELEKMRSLITGRIVIIGTSAEALLDLRSTPIETVVPGVAIQADIMDQIISGTFLNRPDIASGIELFSAIVSVILLLTLMSYLSAIGDALSAITLCAISIFGFWYAFSSQQLLLSPIVPVVSILLAYSFGVAADFLITERQGRFVRNAFNHYLSPTMVARLADNPDNLKLGGEEKELSILFCDIRGFTSYSEGMNPVELTDFLNNFLTPMTTTLLDSGATIDKYMGDAIMAFWNAPLDQQDHRKRACNGVLGMRAALNTLNETASHSIKVGIGVNTGPCCVGNLGSSQRFNYSAIGDAVNVSSRIEGLTKYYGLDNLVAKEALAPDGEFATLEIDSVSVVGREQPLVVFTLLGNAELSGNEDYQNLLIAQEKMLTAYRTGDVKAGKKALGEARKHCDFYQDGSLSRLYEIYEERFTALAKKGMPDNWDGVYRPTSK